MTRITKIPEGYNLEARGIIPNPIDAGRINLDAIAVGVQTTVIYTVPAGKILFISSCLLSSRESANASSLVYVVVRNIADTEQYTPLLHYYDLAGHQTTTSIHLPALELPAGWDIAVISGHANIDGRGGIRGWLEDA